MEFSYFISTIPLWLVLLIMLILSGMASGMPWLIRKKFPLAHLKENHEIGGFKFSAIGVIYAVLLAFATIQVWEQFELADQAAENESVTITGLWELTSGYHEPLHTELRNQLKAYATDVVEKEWPALGEPREVPQDARRALHSMFLLTCHVMPDQVIDQAVHEKMVDLLVNLNEQRGLRLMYAEYHLKGFMWIMLIIGALITIGFTFFFGSRNIRAQAAMTWVLTFLILQVLFIITLMNYPYSGDFSISSHAMQHALWFMERYQ